ncbi:MAG: HAD-IIB family hydrolase [Cyanophyceae cyanobacterium]
MALIIFTDLDGTLLNQDDYDYRPVLPVLAKLKERQIPVIPVTSKTRLEVEVLRQQLQLTDPFIVENGSGIFISASSQRFGSVTGPLKCHRLGCTYTQARAGLQAIASELAVTLRGFGDLDPEALKQLTGLTIEEAKRAKAREFSEPFVTPDSVPSKQLEQAAEQQGLRVLVGDRFSHLIAKDTGKGRAVCWLVQQYRSVNAQLVTVGLGNSPNDEEMLAAVDIAFIVPGRDGPHPELVQRGLPIAPAPGSQGWAAAVAQLAQRYW